MPIKAFYSLEPGEAIVAEEIKRRYPNLHIFIPEKDVGIDLIVLGDLSKPARYPVTIQVKESKYHPPDRWRPVPYSWHQVRKRKLEELTERVDFFVFLTYVDVPEGNRIRFRKEFIVVSTQKLLELCKGKKTEVYDFYLAFEYGKDYKAVNDIRDMRGRKWTREDWERAPSYLSYYNNWEQIVEFLEKQEDIRAGLIALNEPGAISWEEYKRARVQGE